MFFYSLQITVHTLVHDIQISKDSECCWLVHFQALLNYILLRNKCKDQIFERKVFRNLTLINFPKYFFFLIAFIALYIGILKWRYCINLSRHNQVKSQAYVLSASVKWQHIRPNSIEWCNWRFWQLWWSGHCGERAVNNWVMPLPAYFTHMRCPSKKSLQGRNRRTTENAIALQVGWD